MSSNSASIRLQAKKRMFLQMFKEDPCVYRTAMVCGFRPRTVRLWIQNDLLFRADILKIQIDALTAEHTKLQERGIEQRLDQLTNIFERADTKKRNRIPKRNEPMSYADQRRSDIADRCVAKMRAKKAELARASAR